MTFTFLIRVVTHLVDSFLGGLYPSAEKLGPISIPRGSLGGMFFKFIYKESTRCVTTLIKNVKVI
jgi:hypothetical protein